ncbi:uncharacterized protein [Leptinotarsa decemlineata]|uniref:uncharacterized protein n=1 Tax=Leptinotarsa decemlineata TaxID=7539 RepID=UPI003D309072
MAPLVTRLLNNNGLGITGGKLLASALTDCYNCSKKYGKLLALKVLEELTLGFNKIRRQGALRIVESTANKNKLKSLILEGNQFGEDDSETDDTHEENDESDAEDEDEESEKENESIKVVTTNPKKVDVAEFLESPSANNFIALGNDRIEMITKEATKNEDICMDDFVKIVMKVPALSNNMKPEVADSALKCSESLYKGLFSWAQKTEKISLVINAILVNLGLIKSEDKKAKVTWNLEGCLYALKYIAIENYVPDSTKDSVFIERDIQGNKDNLELKKQIVASLIV